MRAHVLVALGICGGCARDVSDTSAGEQGRVELTMQPSSGEPGDECFVGCAIDHPLLLGTLQSISVANTREVPLLHSQSSDPDVLAIEDHLQTCCNLACEDGDHYDECLARGGDAQWSQNYRVTAVGSGQAHLELLTEDGAVYDRFPIAVHEAASVELQLYASCSDGKCYQTVHELDLAGTHSFVRAIARDSNGDRLFAALGIKMELQDPQIAAFYGARATDTSGYSELWQLARGSEMLSVSAGKVLILVPVISR